MKKVVISFLLISFWANPIFASPKPAYSWNKLAQGVLYAKYTFVPEQDKRTIVHAFQLDPTKVKLRIVTANSSSSQGETVKAMAKQAKANLVINGGFFTPEHKSIGLMINKGKVLNSLHKTSWWSIFVLKNNKATIIRPKDYKFSKKIQMAIQAGPRLVVNGHIPKHKKGKATRTAIGIDKFGKIILVVTDGSSITLNKLANKMKESRYNGGLECKYAMALDGGGSSQLYADIGDFELFLPGVSTIPNGLAVFIDS